MKERPILFKTEMVRAILDGRKTQTRRVIKPQPPCGLGKLDVSEPIWTYTESDREWRCPYGQIGDRSWVREAWGVGSFYDKFAPREIPELGTPFYRADNNPRSEVVKKWRPSIFMPRWASRITLEITDVRIERVQDISEADAKAEGIFQSGAHGAYAPRYYEAWIGDRCISNESGVYVFRCLWDSINAKRGYSWDSNPFVWVVTFDWRNSHAPTQLRSI